MFGGLLGDHMGDTSEATDLGCSATLDSLSELESFLFNDVSGQDLLQLSAEDDLLLRTMGQHKGARELDTKKAGAHQERLLTRVAFSTGDLESMSRVRSQEKSTTAFTQRVGGVMNSSLLFQPLPGLPFTVDEGDETGGVELAVSAAPVPMNMFALQRPGVPVQRKPRTLVTRPAPVPTLQPPGVRHAPAASTTVLMAPAPPCAPVAAPALKEEHAEATNNTKTRTSRRLQLSSVAAASRPMLRRVQSTGDLSAYSSSLRSSTSMAEAEAEGPLDDGIYRVGQYTLEERRLRILRYRQKRHERNFDRKIKYACRKMLADSRPRVGGRFAKNEGGPPLPGPDGLLDEDDLLDFETDDLMDDSLLPGVAQRAPHPMCWPPLDRVSGTTGGGGRSLREEQSPLAGVFN